MSAIYFQMFQKKYNVHVCIYIYICTYIKRISQANVVKYQYLRKLDECYKGIICTVFSTLFYNSKIILK